MPFTVRPCARCARENVRSERFCSGCGLPLGTVVADVDAGHVALGPYEAPEPADPDVTAILHDFIERTGVEAVPSGAGWRMVVSPRLDRQQAVYVGPAGTDPEGRPLIGLVSVCGPATERDALTVLKWNARTVEGHFAVKNLLGEDYFVVIHNVAATLADSLDPPNLLRRIAEVADGLEDRLSRGRDIY